MQISDPRSRVLAFDFGTGGLTVGLFNPHENHMVGFGGASYGNLSGLADPSWKEQDPRLDRGHSGRDERTSQGNQF